MIQTMGSHVSKFVFDSSVVWFSNGEGVCIVVDCANVVATITHL